MSGKMGENIGASVTRAESQSDFLVDKFSVAKLIEGRKMAEGTGPTLAMLIVNLPPQTTYKEDGKGKRKGSSKKGF